MIDVNAAIDGWVERRIQAIKTAAEETRAACLASSVPVWEELDRKPQPDPDKLATLVTSHKNQVTKFLNNLGERFQR